MIEIKTRYTGICIKKSAALSLSEADLSAADLCGADLSGADLRGADLSAADLSGADLCGADLSAADLCGADLSAADLREADLSEADLRGADLSEADLRGADLCGAVGNGKEVNTIVCDGLIAVWHRDSLTIGCKRLPMAEWMKMPDKEIQKIGDLDLWKKWKPIFKALIPEEQQ